mmetsp:Transcript_27285/g.24081  ORF Transcript_27285/g.24081 Transcript_27285/m.24081 type:complete len:105 (+) Transcript_27285:49-363(+)
MSNQKNDQYDQIYELQREIVAAAHKAKFYESTALQLKRNSDKCRISIKEIDGLEEQHKAFKPLGKAFVLRKKDDIKAELEDNIKNNDKEIEEQAKFKVHFEGKQ